MKNTILCLILIATQSAMAQSLPDLIRKYEKECSALVPDTVQQRGKIAYDLVPVKNEHGAVMTYVTGASDTTWEKPTCPEYKFEVGNMRFLSTGYQNIRYFSTEFDYGVQPTIDSSGKRQIVGTVTRPHACLVRLREVQPWSEHFWNWLKKQ